MFSLVSQQTATDRGSATMPISAFRCVYIDEMIPDNLRDSGSVDVYDYLQQLKLLGASICFLSLFRKIDDQPKEALRFIERFPDVKLYDLNSINALIEEEKGVKIVFYSRITTYTALGKMFRDRFSDAKHCFLTVDLHHKRLFAQHKLTNASVHYHQAKKYEVDETQAVVECEATVVVNINEAEYLQKRTGSFDIFWIPLLRSAPGRAAGPDERERRCIFIGNFSHPPNIDAVQYLEQEWPIIYSATSIKLTVVGSNMPNSWRTKSSSTIEYLGFVEDLAPLMSKVICSVAPLRYGAGEKGKVLLSMGFGVPVLGSKFASDGMFEDGCIGFQACNSIDEYIDKLNRLSADTLHWIDSSNDALRLAASRSVRLLRNYLEVLVAHLLRREKQHERHSLPLNQESAPTVSVVMLTLGSKVRPTLNARFLADLASSGKSFELIIANQGEPLLSTGYNPDFVREAIVPHWNPEQRLLHLVRTSRGSHLRFVSDDDPITTHFGLDLEKVTNLLRSNERCVFFNEVVIFSSVGFNIGQACSRNLDPLRTYFEFISTSISKTAFYAFFPKDIVGLWARFLIVKKIPFPYIDWILTYLAFQLGEVNFGTTSEGFAPNLYFDTNWFSLEVSIQSTMNHLLSNDFPVWLAVVSNVVWIYDLIRVSDFARSQGRRINNAMLELAIRDQIQRARLYGEVSLNYYIQKYMPERAIIDSLKDINQHISKKEINLGHIIKKILTTGELDPGTKIGKLSGYFDF